jgi:hypothetical protein
VAHLERATTSRLHFVRYDEKSRADTYTVSSRIGHYGSWLSTLPLTSDPSTALSTTLDEWGERSLQYYRPTGMMFLVKANLICCEFWTDREEMGEIIEVSSPWRPYILQRKYPPPVIAAYLRSQGRSSSFGGFSHGSKQIHSVRYVLLLPRE